MSKSKSVRKRSAPRQQLLFELPSLTQQEFASESDINNIMAKYSYSDMQSFAQDSPRNYLDLSDPIDFQLHQDEIVKANAAFAELPAKVRKEFDNDPVKFLEFVHNEDNRDEMLRLGLLAEKQESNTISSSAKQNSENAEGAAPIST